MKMGITTKIKLAAVGLAALICGCNNPINEKEGIIYISKEGARVKSLNYDGHSGYWDLTCETEQGMDVFFRKNSSDPSWKKYPIEKE